MVSVLKPPSVRMEARVVRKRDSCLSKAVVRSVKSKGSNSAGEEDSAGREEPLEPFRDLGSSGVAPRERSFFWREEEVVNVRGVRFRGEGLVAAMARKVLRGMAPDVVAL